MSQKVDIYVYDRTDGSDKTGATVILKLLPDEVTQVTGFTEAGNGKYYKEGVTEGDYAVYVNGTKYREIRVGVPLRDDEVGTDNIADGAVTAAKTDFMEDEAW